MLRDTPKNKNPNPRHQWQKILKTERFNLFQEEGHPNLFEVSWNRSNGTYGRRRFNAATVEMAVQRAPIEAGLEPDTPRMEAVQIVEAFRMALSESRRGAESRREWLYDQKRFMGWLLEHYPDCTHWCLITRKIIREYLLTFEGKSPNRKRLAMQPIVQTAGFMEREYQAPNVTGRLRIGSGLVRETPKVFLIDVLMFLDWLQEEDWKIEVGAALQGLAGLQLQEALRLTWSKVDLEHGLIEISGEVKNKFRERVIPVPQRCLKSLKHAYALQSSAGVIDLDGPVVQSPNGCSYAGGKRSWCNYSEALRKKIRVWNPKLTWTSKDLRNCIQTFHKMEGSDGDMMEIYVGHSPKTVTMKHYVPRLAAGSLGESEALETAMNAFRTLIVNPVDREIERLYRTIILKNFEREGVKNSSGNVVDFADA